MKETTTGAHVQGLKQQREPYLMVIDLDPHHCYYMTMLLQRFDYRVVPAISVDEALKTFSAAVPALVIADADLPDGGAARLIRQIRADARARKPAVIGMLANDGDPSSYRNRGFDACLSKPVPAEELYRMTQAMIEPTPRTSIRIHTKLPVMVNGKPLDCVEGECASVLSEHGMYIRTLRPLQVNSQVSVTLMVDGRAIPLNAEVRYCHRFGEGPFGEPGMGLKFTDIAPHDQDHIRNFIHADVTRGLERSA